MAHIGADAVPGSTRWVPRTTMCWMTRGAGAAGLPTCAAGLAAALVSALLGCPGLLGIQLLGAFGRAGAQLGGSPAGAVTSARRGPAEAARNNLLLRRIRPVHPGSLANSSRLASATPRTARFSEKIQPGQVMAWSDRSTNPKTKTSLKPKSNAPGPARRAGAPEPPRIHSTEDAPPSRRGMGKRLASPMLTESIATRLSNGRKPISATLLGHLGPSRPGLRAGRRPRARSAIWAIPVRTVVEMMPPVSAQAAANAPTGL